MDSRRTWTPELLASLLLASIPSLPPALAMDVPPLIQAEQYRVSIDPAGYWISEKLDGVRAYWDGTQLRFRSGRVIAAPTWFTQGFPAQALDGELWIGRGQFDRLSGIVRKEVPVDAEWRDVRYVLFEMPQAAGDFSTRLAGLRELVGSAGLSQLQVLEQFHLDGRQALQARLDEIVRGGGEGLMLHRADAPYLAGRNEDLLKLKPWEDAEAVVVEHLPGQGKYTGQLGALLVELPNGQRLRIGTGLSDAQRAQPPQVGSQITFRYRGQTGKGLPRFASFLRVREAF